MMLMMGLMLAPLHAKAQTSSQKTPRIIGGTEAAPDAWEWMAALVSKWQPSNYNGLFCGASLIHPRWIVTAAHCMEGENTHSFEVLLGVHDLKDDTGERVGVRQIITHPNYDNYSLDSDIALVELENEVSYQTISPFSGEDSLTGEEAIALGWGTVDAHRYEYPTGLQQVTVPIVPDSLCREAYAPWDDVTENMICAGYEEGGKDSCSGDSGGPLIVQYQTEWKLAGITSWGEGCAEPGYYGVYTRISEFADFINSYVPGSSSAVAGDVNQDGKAGMEDAIAILQAVTRFTTTSSSDMDVNQDGTVDLKDLVNILQILSR